MESWLDLLDEQNDDPKVLTKADLLAAVRIGIAEGLADQLMLNMGGEQESVGPFKVGDELEVRGCRLVVCGCWPFGVNFTFVERER